MLSMGFPEVKLQRFADEARALNLTRMHLLNAPKRFTLAVALIRIRTAQALDDLTEMFLRRLQKLHQQAHDALEEYRLQHQDQTDALIAFLGQIVMDWQASNTPVQRLQAIDALIGEDVDTIRAPCETHLGYAGNNDLPFLLPLLHPIASCSWMSWSSSTPRRPMWIRPWNRRSPLCCAIAGRGHHGCQYSERRVGQRHSWSSRGSRRVGGKRSLVAIGAMGLW